MKSPVAEGELPFMDQQAKVHVAVHHRVLDLVEGCDDGLEHRLEQAEREVGAGHESRHGDALAADVGLGHRRASDETRSVAVAHRGAVRQQRVRIREIRVRVNRNGGHLELAT